MNKHNCAEGMPETDLTILRDQTFLETPVILSVPCNLAPASRRTRSVLPDTIFGGRNKSKALGGVFDRATEIGIDGAHECIAADLHDA